MFIFCYRLFRSWFSTLRRPFWVMQRIRVFCVSPLAMKKTTLQVLQSDLDILQNVAPLYIPVQVIKRQTHHFSFFPSSATIPVMVILRKRQVQIKNCVFGNGRYETNPPKRGVRSIPTIHGFGGSSTIWTPLAGNRFYALFENCVFLLPFFIHW